MQWHDSPNILSIFFTASPVPASLRFTRANNPKQCRLAMTLFEQKLAIEQGLDLSFFCL